MALSLEIMREKASAGIDKAYEELSLAKDASADLISPVYFAQAMKAFEDSKESFKLERYEESVRHSNDAYGYALRAYEDSKEKLAFREEIADKLSGAYGVRVEKEALGVRILFDKLFLPNGDNLLFDAYPSIDAAIDVLRGYPDLELALYAYSASFPSEKKNISSSKKRMDAVYNYIASRGFDGSRFTRKEGLGSGKDKGAISAQVEIVATVKIPYTPPPEGTPPPIEAPGML
jgi:outer membrane protein OmpA-like peptidoglycan-associated protein